ncbi:hypothetical protein lerEdw1_014812, partial [Lerista edwardsae]
PFKFIVLHFKSKLFSFYCSFPPEGSNDAEMDIKFTCVTQLLEIENYYLICKVMGAEETVNGTFVNFAIVRGKSLVKCLMKSPLEGRCPITLSDLVGDVDVCLTWMDQQTMSWMEQQSPQQCLKVKPVNIVKPEAPVDLNITYQEAANEYLIRFSTPHRIYLDTKLKHEIAFRQPNGNWATKEFEHLELKLQGKEFQPGERYEIKIRSKPNGDFFKGPWSEWSPSVYIDTVAKPTDQKGEEHALIIASIFGFILLLLMISMVPIFWKNRIKPIVWPTLPNHEKTLEKLCHKLRKNSDITFFTPESLGYVHIHKVDSIQAKSEMSHFPQSSLPWNADISKKMGNEKHSLTHINHGWLKLPLAYEGMWPAEVQNGPLGGRQPASSDTFIHATLSDESSTGGSSGDTLSTRSSSSMDPTILAGLEADSCRQTDTSSQTRVSSDEEAYVTMASFFQNNGKAGK